MSRKCAVCLLVLGIALGWSATIVWAQEAAVSKPRTDDVEKAPSAYRLDFSIHELEDGKKVNTRQYSMNLMEGGPWQDLKIGTRVPVEIKQGEMQYIDVGTNISAQLLDVKSAPTLTVRADLSNFARPDQEQRTSMPLLRQLRINGSTIVTTGKPIVVGVVDDPNSKRQFQLEVTVTKLK